MSERFVYIESHATLHVKSSKINSRPDMIFSPCTGHTCINDSIGISKRNYENVVQVIISCYLLLAAYGYSVRSFSIVSTD